MDGGADGGEALVFQQPQKVKPLLEGVGAAAFRVDGQEGGRNSRRVNTRQLSCWAARRGSSGRRGADAEQGRPLAAAAADALHPSGSPAHKLHGGLVHDWIYDVLARVEEALAKGRCRQGAAAAAGEAAAAGQPSRLPAAGRREAAGATRPAHPPATKYESSATLVAFVSAAAATAVTLAKVAWSGEQVRAQKKCWKLWAQAGHPTRKMEATWTCGCDGRGGEGRRERGGAC